MELIATPGVAYKKYDKDSYVTVNARHLIEMSDNEFIKQILEELNNESKSAKQECP
jgi:hypothetical protein